jgi:Na+-transporting methylmalonyl-CoA/oxaloacetate decarboxylase gamma subunit
MTMDTQAFTFILIVALFGMAIVFTQLIILSGLMRLIRGADQFLVRRTGLPKRGDTGAIRAKPRKSGPGETGSLDWTVSAAVAYLDLEERESATEASGWTRGRAGTEDPWLDYDAGASS